MLHFCIFENNLSLVSPPIALNLKKYFLSFNLCLPFKMKYKFHFQNANFFLTFNSIKKLFHFKMQIIFTFVFKSIIISFLKYKLSSLSNSIQNQLLCKNIGMIAMGHHTAQSSRDKIFYTSTSRSLLTDSNHENRFTLVFNVTVSLFFLQRIDQSPLGIVFRFNFQKQSPGGVLLRKSS